MLLTAGSVGVRGGCLSLFVVNITWVYREHISQHMRSFEVPPHNIYDSAILQVCVFFKVSDIIVFFCDTRRVTRAVNGLEWYGR